MAILIKTNGVQEPKTPKNGTDFTLEELRSIVGCDYIEIARIQGTSKFFVIDEEGKLNDKAPNPTATLLYGNPYDYIVGNALLCDEGEVR